MRYPVVMSRDTNGTVLVRFPDLPEAITFGDTKEDALGHAADALVTAIDARMKDRQNIPTPSRGRVSVELPSLMVAKVGLYQAMRDKKVGKSELGRRLNVHLPQVDRLLAMRHASRLDQLDGAFAALGKRLVLHIEDNETPQVARARASRPRAHALTAKAAR